jgi:hypothetical protein
VIGAQAPAPHDVAHAATVVDRSVSNATVTRAPTPEREAAPAKVVVVQREPSTRQGGSFIFTVFVLLVVGGIVTVFWLMANGTQRIKIPRSFPDETIRALVSPSASASGGKPAAPKK